MPITLTDVPGLPQNDVYRQVSIATGTRLVFVAGQVDWSASGTAADADLTAQVEQCYLHVGTALAAAGASFQDVAKLTIYVVDWNQDKMTALLEGIARALATLGATAVPPVTLIGVAALASPSHLVEVEATAVLE